MRISRSWAAAAVTILVTISTRRALAQGFTPGCSPPFGSLAEHHPIDDSCPKMRGDVPDPPVGPNDAAHALQNTMKNNLCATGAAIPVAFFTFKQLQKKLDQKIPAALNWGRDNLPADRSGLKNVHTTSDGATIGEGSVVQLSAWVLKSKTGGKESVNCQVSTKQADNDLHIVLVNTSAHDASECSSVTAETSPHLRPESWDGSEILQALDHPLRFTGQLFYDASHRPCSGSPPHAGSSAPARVSSWEIHPVYGIDVCKFKSLQNCKVDNNSAWTRIDQWTPLD